MIKSDYECCQSCLVYTIDYIMRHSVVVRVECVLFSYFFFFFQAEDGIRDYKVTGVQTCALPISG